MSHRRQGDEVLGQDRLGSAGIGREVDAGGVPAIDQSDLFYDGNSQGGIMGGALMAIAQEIGRISGAAVVTMTAARWWTKLKRCVTARFAIAHMVFTEPVLNGVLNSALRAGSTCLQANRHFHSLDCASLRPDGAF